MAWPGKGKTTEEIFGMTEEELKAQITSTKELPQKFEDIKKEVNEKIDSFSTKLDSVIDSLKNLNVNNSHRTDDGTEHNDNKLTDWNDDPDRAHAERSRPVVGLALSAKADVVKDQTLRELEFYSQLDVESGRRVPGPLYDEINKEIEKQPLEARINPEFVKNCYNVVVGRHSREIQEDAVKGSGKFFIESGGRVSSSSTINPEKKPADKLTDKELEYCKKFNMTPEQYVAQKGKLTYV